VNKLASVSATRVAPPGAEEIIAASPTALLLVNPADQVILVNASTETLLNASSAHLIGRLLEEVLILPRGRKRDEEGPYAAYDVSLSTPRGAEFRADLLITPLPERAGWKLVSLQAGAAAHRMGHRLERGSGARAAVGIAAMLAHEIKNPLSSRGSA
jgi:two-component system, NtrC family, nitrogen regulation sensor histidine kinase GlnL